MKINPFLKPVHGVLTSEWKRYSDLAKEVNDKISRGEMRSGCHDCCSFSWFDELAQSGHAQQSIEQLFKCGYPAGSRHYFRLPQ